MESSAAKSMVDLLIGAIEAKKSYRSGVMDEQVLRRNAESARTETKGQ